MRGVCFLACVLEMQSCLIIRIHRLFRGVALIPSSLQHGTVYCNLSQRCSAEKQTAKLSLRSLDLHTDIGRWIGTSGRVPSARLTKVVSAFLILKVPRSNTLAVVYGSACEAKTAE